MIRLTAVGMDPLVIDDWETGIACQELDLGWPVIRSVAEDRPGTDGTFDETAHFGARVVSVKLALFEGTGGNRRALLDQLTAFCHPGLRPVLEFEDPTGGGMRCVTLRPDQGSAPLTNPRLTDVQLAFVAPSGVITSCIESELDLSPANEAPGLTFPITFDVSWPEFIGGPGVAVNTGTVPAEWTAYIYGPVTGPMIENLNTGEVLSFPGLTIDAGDYLLVDTASRTALVNGVASASRYSFLDFTNSTWWRLGAGASPVLFSAESAPPPASMRLVWRDAFLS